MVIKDKERGLIQSLIKETQGTESEIKERNIRDALCYINAIDRNENVIRVEDISTWSRGGNETYISVVEIELVGSVRRLIAKALVPFGERPEDALNKRIRRRNNIKQLGISVPHLYYTYKATIYEQFISNRVEVGSIEDASMSRQVGIIGGTLDRSQYSHINYIKDLRHDGSSVYLTDFGFDIGGREIGSKHSCLMQIKNSFASDNMEDIMRGYRHAFEESQKID